MQRASSRSFPGSGGDSIAFAPVAADEIEGVRLATKICELCGKVFLREALERECKACELRMARLKESSSPPRREAEKTIASQTIW